MRWRGLGESTDLPQPVHALGPSAARAARRTASKQSLHSVCLGLRDAIGLRHLLHGPLFIGAESRAACRKRKRGKSPETHNE
jgi:hypothetical protein